MSPNELQELEIAARELNEESNDINQTIAALNEKLAALNVGLEVWLAPDEDHTSIGFDKINEKWQLAVRYAKEINFIPDDDDPKCGVFELAPNTECEYDPLLQASRALRIRALEYMPSLIRTLRRNAESGRDAIRAAKKLAAEL